MVFRKKNIAMIQSKHCDGSIGALRWFKSFIAMLNSVEYQLYKTLFLSNNINCGVRLAFIVPDYFSLHVRSFLPKSV